MTDTPIPEWLASVPRYVWPSRDARSPLPPESIMVRLADVVAAAQERSAGCARSLLADLNCAEFNAAQRRSKERLERAEVAEAERDAMQRRAEAAEADWQAAESRINELEVMVRDAQAGQPDLTALRAAVARARTFIEYARYELQPGKAQLGDQFPRQDDADDVLAVLDAARELVKEQP